MFKFISIACILFISSTVFAKENSKHIISQDNIAMDFPSFIEVNSCYFNRNNPQPKDLVDCIRLTQLAGGDFIDLKKGQSVFVKEVHGLMSIIHLTNSNKNYYVFAI